MEKESEILKTFKLPSGRTAPIRIAPCGKDGNEVEVRLNYFQGDLQTKKLCDVSWHKQNPAYVEENLSGTMAVGSHAWVGAADLISIQLNPVGQACREIYSSREFKYTIKDGDGVISIDEYGTVWAILLRRSMEKVSPWVST